MKIRCYYCGFIGSISDMFREDKVSKIPCPKCNNLMRKITEKQYLAFKGKIKLKKGQTVLNQNYNKNKRK